MKKLSKIFAGILALGLSVTSFVGCGGQVVEQSDVPSNPEATVIYMSVYSGGFGSEWARKAATAFNNSQTDYFVSILPDNKDDLSTIQSKIESKTTQADVFMAANDIEEMANRGLLMDVSDLYTETDANGKTLKDHIIDFKDWEYSLKYNGKYYGIPHNDELISAVYDHELFASKGWLMTDDDGNLTAGKDGKTGTYDDGLPISMSDWDDMVGNILSDGVMPYVYSGKFSFYTNYFMLNIWAQYTGAENFKLNYTFDGDFYSVETGNTTTITTENGYLLASLDGGRRPAYEFAYKTLNDKRLVHPKSFLSSTHTDAQNYFVLGYKEASGNPRSAILFDGIWWQNEARPIFNALEEEKEYNYAYGKHDYRLLLAPNAEGGYGVDGNGKGSVVTTLGNCVVFAQKTTDTKKEAAVKAWMRYLYSDECSRMYTTTCGGVRPYKYSLTADEYASLNPFVKSVWDVYSDYENIKIVRVPLLIKSNSINYRPLSNVASPLAYSVNGIIYGNFLGGVKSGVTTDQMVAGAAALYTPETWARMVSEL